MNLFMQKNVQKGTECVSKYIPLTLQAKIFSGFGSIMIEIRFKPATHCFKQNKREI